MNMRGGHRLTLAPATRRALRPRGTDGDDKEANADVNDDDDQRIKEGRDALSRAVAVAANAFIIPKPIHGVQYSKFWASSDYDSDSSLEETSEEDITVSTPVLIKEAAAAGFSLSDLQRAEQELQSPSQVCAGPSNSLIANKIVSTLVQRKLKGQPWKGPLPPPRVSPPRTLGDAIAVAKVSHSLASPFNSRN